MPNPIAIRSVLAATDLTTSSREAMRSAAMLAAHTGAELHLLYALEPSRAAGGEDVLEMQRRIHEARAALREEAAEVIPLRDQARTLHIELGRAPAAIRDRARTVGADVIVLGPHRDRGFGDRVLGTTADQVVRECRVPCLVIRGPLTMPLRRVLVPSDLSDVARGAAGAAVRWAEALQRSTNPSPAAELTVLHIDAETAPGGAGTVPRFQRWTELGEHTAAARKLAGPAGAPRVQREILYGTSPAEEILDFARETRTELVVMGTRGDRPLVKALLGSVSAAVARASDTPLLLLPPAVWRELEAAPEPAA